VYVALGLVVLTLAKLARDVVTRYGLEEEIVAKGNVAVALRLSGYLLGVILVFLGAVYQPLGSADAGYGGLGFDRAFGLEALWVFLYSLAGIVALNLMRVVTDRLVLYRFELEREIVQDQNVGAAAAEFGVNVAAGLVIAGAIAGQGGPLNALAFFGLGLGVLILFALFYEWTTPFNIHDEIERDNPAVGITLGGNLVAIGLVIFKATFGDFVGWQEGILEFVVYSVVGFALLYVLRLAVDLVLLPHTRVSQQVAAGRNVGVAFVETAVVVSSALILLVAV
jgi:uncharacterized membrane protein YjfL (UPF0719 family)